MIISYFTKTRCSLHHLNFTVRILEHHSYSMKKCFWSSVYQNNMRCYACRLGNILLGVYKGIDLDLTIFDSFNFLGLVMNNWIYKRHSPKHLKFCFITIDFNFRTFQKISFIFRRINCVIFLKMQTIQQFLKHSFDMLIDSP